MSGDAPVVMERLLRDLQQLVRDSEREKIEWSLERSDLESKVASLESALLAKERSLTEYLRRIALLEFALKSERYKLNASEAPPTLSSLPEGPSHNIEILIPQLEAVISKPRVKSCRGVISRYLSSIREESSIPISPESISAPSKSWSVFHRMNAGLEAVRCVDKRGGLVATGASDGSITVWQFIENSDEPEVFQTLRGHREGVVAVSFLEEGGLISGGMDGTIRLWEVPSSYDAYGTYRKFSVQVVSGHDDALWSLRTRKGAAISAGSDGYLILWRISGDTNTARFRGDNYSSPISISQESKISIPDKEIGQVTWHPGNIRKAILACRSGVVGVADFSNETVTYLQPCSDSGVPLCSESWTSETSSYFVGFGFSNGSLKIAELVGDGGQWVKEINTGSAVQSVLVNDVIFTGGADGLLRVWKDGQLAQEIFMDNKNQHEAINALKLEDHLLLAAGADGSLQSLKLA